MRGLMMDRPLLITSILRHAAQNHGKARISSRFALEPNHSYTYREAWARTQQLANVLVGLGVGHGHRVATLAWNDHRHLELYYAISGIGAVCHTVNPRLYPEQLVYILNHAEDRVLFVDPTFLPLVEKLLPQLRTVRTVVVMTQPHLMPESAIPGLLCYETLMQAAPAEYDWPEFDENTASGLCYTSGTTGNPKGVMYSHRSTVLHAFGLLATPDLTLSPRDTAMPVVPLFHVNAWGYPYACPIVGTSMAFPGPKLDGKSMYELIEEEGVTVTSGVPTLWLRLLEHLRATKSKFSTLKVLTIGGAAAPRAMVEEFEFDYGIKVFQGWGMTEMSPIGTFGSLTPEMEEWPVEKRHDMKVRQGRSIFGVEMKIVDAEGNELPRDGKAFGELVVRGPWITSGYFADSAANEGAFTADGWFRTGDVSTIDPDGFMTIVDRAKDVIKSGGEWISSIDLENAAMGHAEVAEAAVIGLPHPQWTERPLLIVVRRPGATVDKAGILSYLEQHVAKWWLPDDVVFVNELPHTATGKILKSALRKDFAGYRLPGAAE